jgi:hypothetical protein
MVSNNNLIGCHIKATIALVLCWITNEDTNSRMGSELVSGRVGEVQITLAPKKHADKRGPDECHKGRSEEW